MELLKKKIPDFSTKLLLTSLATTSIILLLSFLFLTKSNIKYKVDFIPFYSAGKIVRDGNLKDLYDYETQINYQRGITESIEQNPLPANKPDYDLLFIYLPFVAYLLSIFSFLNFVTSLKIFIAFNLFLIFAQALGTAKKARVDTKTVILLTLAFIPLMANITYTQISIWIALTPTLALLVMQMKDSKLKYFILGLVTFFLWIKPQFIILSLILLIISKRRFYTLAGIFIVAASAYLVGIKTLGLHYVVNFIGFISHIEQTSNINNYMTISSYQALLKFFVPENQIFRVTLIVCIAGLIYSVARYYKLHNTWSPEKKIFIALIITLVFSMHAFVNDYIMLLIPIIYLYKESKSYYWTINLLAATVFFYASFLQPVFLTLYLLKVLNPNLDKKVVEFLRAQNLNAVQNARKIFAN